MRHKFLLESLKEEICLGNYPAVVRVTDLIEDNSPDALLFSDNERKNLLHLALDNNAGPEIYSFLFPKLQSKGQSIIFETDIQQRTLIWYAAKAGFETVVEELIEIAALAKRDDWLWIVDKEKNIAKAKNTVLAGNTPLHMAAKSGFYAIIRLLLNAIQNKDGAIDKINTTNAEGCTPLYLIYDYLRINSKEMSKESRMLCYETIQALIDSGASLTICNNSLDSPFHLHCQLSVKKQLHLLSYLMTEDNKDYLLDLYKAEIASYPELAFARSVYFRHMGKKSLLSLLFAHHEYNTQIPPRTTFEMPIDETTVVERIVPDHILWQMPTYAKRIEHLKQETDTEKTMVHGDFFNSRRKPSQKRAQLGEGSIIQGNFFNHQMSN